MEAARGEILALMNACKEAAERNERDLLRRTCRELVEKLKASGACLDEQLPVTDVRELLLVLRNARAFDELTQVGGVFVLLGQKDVKVNKLFAQGLIDSGQLAAAIDVLTRLIADAKIGLAAIPEANPDHDKLKEQYLDAIAIRGRAEKQTYIDMKCAGPGGLCTGAMQRAIGNYAQAYNEGVPGNREYAGANLVALLARAERDKVPVEGAPAFKELAAQIIAETTANSEKSTDAWAQAAIAEAYLALGNLREAAKYYGGYVIGADRFMLAGTIRNLEEIWEIRAGSKDVWPILMALKLQLLSLDGGSVTFSREEKAEIAHASPADLGELPKLVLARPEAVIAGRSTMTTLADIFRPVECGKGVARITQGVGKTNGTGFLIRGSDMCPSLGNDLYVLTNAHVVSRLGTNMPAMATSALHPSCVRITFDAEFVFEGENKQYKCESVWESPPDQLDVTLLRVIPQPAPPVVPLSLAGDQIQLVVDDKRDNQQPTRLVIIGYPEGRDLSLSNDLRGTLLEIGIKPPENNYKYLHYRTSTKPGNSGSPVIEDRGYTVVGLHRAGPDRDGGRIPKLNGQPGGIEANEGVFIQSIRDAFRAARGTAVSPPVIPVGILATGIGAASAFAASIGSPAPVTQSAPPRVEFIRLPRAEPQPARGVRRLNYHELIAKLSDPQLGNEDLAPYFTRQADGAPYQPAFVLTPDLVDAPEGEESFTPLVFLANRYSMLRRQAEWRQKSAMGFEGLKFVAEGDSWFEYPVLLDDVVDQLSEQYGIFSIAAAGDTLENIVSPVNFKDQIFPALAEVRPDGFLLSGGGNDIVGDALVDLLIEQQGSNKSKPAECLAPAVHAKLAAIECYYRTAFDQLLAKQPNLKIITHGYDLSVPKPDGPWLGRPFSKRNITDTELMREIIAVLLKRVTGMHLGLEQRYKGRVFFTSCAGCVGDHWYDELHPTNEGFARVADRFRDTIARAFPNQS